MRAQKIDFLPRVEGLDAPSGFALIGLLVVRMSELYEYDWSHPVTDPIQSFGMTSYCLLLLLQPILVLPMIHGLQGLQVYLSSNSLHERVQSGQVRHVDRK